MRKPYSSVYLRVLQTIQWFIFGCGQCADYRTSDLSHKNFVARAPYRYTNILFPVEWAAITVMMKTALIKDSIRLMKQH